MLCTPSAVSVYVAPSLNVDGPRPQSALQGCNREHQLACCFSIELLAHLVSLQLVHQYSTNSCRYACLKVCVESRLRFYGTLARLVFRVRAVLCRAEALTAAQRLQAAQSEASEMSLARSQLQNELTAVEAQRQQSRAQLAQAEQLVQQLQVRACACRFGCCWSLSNIGCDCCLSTLCSLVHYADNGNKQIHVVQRTNAGLCQPCLRRNCSGTCHTAALYTFGH